MVVNKLDIFLNIKNFIFTKHGILRATQRLFKKIESQKIIQVYEVVNDNDEKFIYAISDSKALYILDSKNKKVVVTCIQLNEKSLMKKIYKYL
ncbi:MAG: hypothetical protein ACRCZ0_08670 [Cetobacterium sp.]